MTDAPFNSGIHHHLLDLGYAYVRNEADWEDYGGPESGPRIVGGPAWDEYSNDEEWLAVEESGEVHGPYQNLGSVPEGWDDLPDHGDWGQPMDGFLNMNH